MDYIGSHDNVGNESEEGRDMILRTLLVFLSLGGATLVADGEE